MYRVRVVSLTKQPWILSVLQNEMALCYKIKKSPVTVTPYYALPPLGTRTMHLTRTTSVVTTDEEKPGFLKRIYRKIVPDPAKYRRMYVGYVLYEDIANNINFANFFNEFKMQDTFYSWFVIMELHVWMLMVRYMAEGQFGQEIRNSIVEAMWADVNKRKSKLKHANVVALKKQVVELSHQFNAAIIGYDEGIISDDKVLAAALWRRFFQLECNNPEYLERLVIYIRKQMKELDRIPRDTLLAQRSTKWLDFRKL